MAMRAERAARRNQVGQVRLQIEQADASGKMVFEGRRHLVCVPRGSDSDRAGIFDSRDARRSHRPDWPEWLRQDHLSEAAARRARAGDGRDPPRRQCRGRVLRSATRAAGSGSLGGRHDRRRQRHGHGERTAAACPRVSAGFPLFTRARALTRERALRRRTQSPAAGATVHASGQRPRARRTDQRSRSGNAGAARTATGRVAGDAACSSATIAAFSTTS